MLSGSFIKNEKQIGNDTVITVIDIVVIVAAVVVYVPRIIVVVIIRRTQPPITRPVFLFGNLPLYRSCFRSGYLFNGTCFPFIQIQQTLRLLFTYLLVLMKINALPIQRYLTKIIEHRKQDFCFILMSDSFFRIGTLICDINIFNGIKNVILNTDNQCKPKLFWRFFCYRYYIFCQIFCFCKYK